jgi:hypothetical protein
MSTVILRPLGFCSARGLADGLRTAAEVVGFRWYDHSRVIKITTHRALNHVPRFTISRKIGQFRIEPNQVRSFGVTSITIPRDSIYGLSPMPLAF